MKSVSLQDNLYWLILQASFRAKKGFIKIAEEHDLTVVQLFTLCSMTKDNPLPMHMIADMLNCDASNVTGIIDRLFSQAYIIRQEKPTDRRVKMISLTAKGEELREQIVKEILAYLPKDLDHLNEKQKEQLGGLLKLSLQSS